MLPDFGSIPGAIFQEPLLSSLGFHDVLFQRRPLHLGNLHLDFRLPMLGQSKRLPLGNKSAGAAIAIMDLWLLLHEPFPHILSKLCKRPRIQEVAEVIKVLVLELHLTTSQIHSSGATFHPARLDSGIVVEAIVFNDISSCHCCIQSTLVAMESLPQNDAFGHPLCGGLGELCVLTFVPVLPSRALCGHHQPARRCLGKQLVDKLSLELALAISLGPILQKVFDLLWHLATFQHPGVIVEW